MVRHQAASGRRVRARRGGDRIDVGKDPGHHRERHHPLHGGLRACFPVHNERQHQEWRWHGAGLSRRRSAEGHGVQTRSEEHTSELQSHLNLVCRLLLEKKNFTTSTPPTPPPYPHLPPSQRSSHSNHPPTP